MKPKEWLLKNGHISVIGRGRLSRDHIAIIEDAVKNGVFIEGYSHSTGPVRDTVATSKPKAESKPKADFVGIADMPDPIHNEQEWEAFTTANGKKVSVGMRTVCNGCRNSLSYCFCGTPKVWIDNSTEGIVNFVGRKTPLPSRRW